MATIRLIPSSYSLSNTTYLSVTSASNMYTNTDSTTYATVTNSQSGTTTYYIYLKGFNFGDVPSDAVVSSFTVKFKANEKRASTSTSYRPYLVNNTTTITGSCDVVSTSVAVHEFTGVTATWATIKGYGSNFGIRISNRRSNKNQQSTVNIYGAEIEVNYTIPSDKTLYVKSNGSWVQVSKAFKKVNGVWVEQTDISNVFQSGVNYRYGSG